MTLNQTKIATALMLVALSTAPAFAKNSGTLQLTGVVEAKNDIVITPNGTNNTTLNITGGESAKNVASAAETSNSGTGYIIQMSSQNAGKLVNASDTTRFTNYTISYNGSSYVAPTGTPTTVKTVSSLTGVTTQTSAILANVTAYPSAIAGTYSDVVTFTISAN